MVDLPSSWRERRERDRVRERETWTSCGGRCGDAGVRRRNLKCGEKSDGRPMRGSVESGREVTTGNVNLCCGSMGRCCVKRGIKEGTIYRACKLLFLVYCVASQPSVWSSRKCDPDSMY